jgi:hypothetical protein
MNKKLVNYTLFIMHEWRDKVLKLRLNYSNWDYDYININNLSDIDNIDKSKNIFIWNEKHIFSYTKLMYELLLYYINNEQTINRPMMSS